MDLLTFRLDLKQDYDFSSLFPQGFAPGTGRYEDISISRLSKRQIAAQVGFYGHFITMPGRALIILCPCRRTRCAS